MQLFERWNLQMQHVVALRAGLDTSVLPPSAASMKQWPNHDMDGVLG
jgi:hypothetical protein